MAQSGAPFAAPPLPENAPPPDPYSMPMTIDALAGNASDDYEEWEYEYSTTETEVCTLYVLN